MCLGRTHTFIENGLSLLVTYIDCITGSEGSEIITGLLPTPFPARKEMGMEE